MDIEKDWPQIRRLAMQCFPHYVLSTVSADGVPHAAPMGSIMLGPDQNAVYFEIFTTRIPRNLDANDRVCVLMQRHGIAFWLKSLFKGRFAQPPGLRLLGRAGPRREATEEEKNRWRRRVRFARRFKGHDLLWGNLEFVRDISFDEAQPINLGAMTRGVSEPEGEG